MVGDGENKPSCVPLLFNSGFKLFWRSRGRVKKKEVWPPKAFLKPSTYVWVRDWETYLVFFKTKIKTPISPPKLLQQYICKKNMLKLMHTLLHSESKNILGKHTKYMHGYQWREQEGSFGGFIQPFGSIFFFRKFVVMICLLLYFQYV